MIAGRRGWLGSCLAGLLALQLMGCGTLLYPERQGQRRGELDPAIVLLDGALLVAFVIPGLVAYAIDFHTGAIYLPAGARRGARTADVLRLRPGELSEDRVRKAVRAHTGHDVSWNDPRLEIVELSTPEALAAFLDRGGAAPRV